MNGTDWDIIQQIIQGDSQAFREIVERYKNAVFALCYRMVQNREEAEDLSQEVFVKAYNSLTKYNPEYKFSTWILRIATNTTIDYLRKNRIQTLPLEEEIKTKHETVSAEETFFEQNKQRKIEKAIGELPEEYRSLILLYHYHGLSYKEMAENMNLPMSKVKNRLHRGRHLLKESLKDIREEEMQWTAKELEI